MAFPPFWKQEPPPVLPDPANNYHGQTGTIPKGNKEAIDPKLNVGETGLVSVVDTPTSAPTHDGLFYICKTSSNTYQIDTITARQVLLSSNADVVYIENKGTTNESYKWSIIHLI